MSDSSDITTLVQEAFSWLHPTETDVLISLCETTAFLYHRDVFKYTISGDIRDIQARAKPRAQKLQAAASAGTGTKLAAWYQELGLVTAGAVLYASGPSTAQVAIRQCLALLLPSDLRVSLDLLEDRSTQVVFLACAGIGCNMYSRMHDMLQLHATREQLERAAHAALVQDVVLLCSDAVPAGYREAIAHEVIEHCAKFDELITQLPAVAAEHIGVQPFIDLVHAVAEQVAGWGLAGTPFAFIVAKATWTFSGTLGLSIRIAAAADAFHDDSAGEVALKQWAALAGPQPGLLASAPVAAPAPVPAVVPVATAAAAGLQLLDSFTTPSSAAAPVPAPPQSQPGLTMTEIHRGLPWASHQISAGPLLALLRASAGAGLLAQALQVAIKRCKGIEPDTLLALPIEVATAGALEAADADVRTKKSKKAGSGVSKARIIWRMVALREAAAAAGISGLRLTTAEHLEAALAARNIMQAEWELFVEPWLASLNPPMLRAGHHAGLLLEQVHTLDHLLHMVATLPSDTPAGIDAEWTPAMSGDPPVGRLQVAVHRGDAWRGEQPLAELPCPPKHLGDVTVVVLDMMSLEREQTDAAGRAKLLAAITQLVRGARPWVSAVEGADDINRVIRQLGGDASPGSLQHVPVRVLGNDLSAAKETLPEAVVKRVGGKIGLSGLFDGFFHQQVFKFWQMCDEWSNGASLSPGALEYAALDAAAALELGCWLPPAVGGGPSKKVKKPKKAKKEKKAALDAAGGEASASMNPDTST